MGNGWDGRNKMGKRAKMRELLYEYEQGEERGEENKGSKENGGDGKRRGLSEICCRCFSGAVSVRRTSHRCGVLSAVISGARLHAVISCQQDLLNAAGRHARQLYGTPHVRHSNYRPTDVVFVDSLDVT